MTTPINKRKYPGNPNDPEHRKWVGEYWDLLGAHQFNVLTSVGLRENHYLLDIGCGSFRGARFFMSYLLPGHYFAVESEKWAVEAGIKNEVGQDFINLKKPTFDYNDCANLSVFNRKFDYIIAHSIFIHADKDWIEKCIKEVKKVLNKDGIFVANFFFSNVDSADLGWNYPNPRRYKINTIKKIVQNAGLSMRITKWKHHHGYAHTWVVITHPFSNPNIKRHLNDSLKDKYNFLLVIFFEAIRTIKYYFYGPRN